MRERTPFPRALITRLPNLKLLLTSGTRNASLDLSAFRDAKIPVAGSVSHGDSTVVHCISLILGLSRNLAADDASVKSGRWQTGVATKLAGKTLGLVGLGRLGAPVGKIMSTAFGMKVVAWSSNLTQEAADEKARDMSLAVEDKEGKKTFMVVGKEDLFKEADVVSVHLVLSDRSRGIIGMKELHAMKKEALLVNTSRGPLIDEESLLKVLAEGRIRGAALDVFDIEPLPADSRWRTTKWGQDGRSQVLISPHMGYVEEETLVDWYEQQVENIRRWERGDEMTNVIA